jgi:hypothetical protein
MIKEWLQSKTWKATPEAKSSGYLNQLIALNARRQRLKDLWKDHEKYCKQVIHEEILQTKNKHSVVVLGSGLLHEIPIISLINAFKEVYLVDIVHGPKTFKMGKQVNILNRDVTGFWEIIKTQDKSKWLSLLEKAAPPWPQADLVISANLISQIPILFVEKLISEGFSEQEQEEFCSMLLKNHIRHLQQNSGRSLLIGDNGREFSDSVGKFIRKEPSLVGVSMGKPFFNWTWNLAPIPEFSDTETMKLLMGAWRIKE